MSRTITQDEAWVSTAIGRPGIQVPEKIGMVGGSPSVRASSTTLAGSKLSWILPSTTKTLHGSPDFWGPGGCFVCRSLRVYEKIASAVS